MLNAPSEESTRSNCAADNALASRAIPPNPTTANLGAIGGQDASTRASGNKQSHQRHADSAARPPERAKLTLKDVEDDAHYTVNQVAQILAVSREKARRIVRQEPGVVRIPAGDTTPHSKCTIRVPGKVVRHLYERMVNTMPSRTR